MKLAKVEVPTVEFKLWCERCCIRIAPNEERTVNGGKTYHPHCYSKVFPPTPKPKRRVASTNS